MDNDNDNNSSEDDIIMNNDKPKINKKHNQNKQKQLANQSTRINSLKKNNNNNNNNNNNKIKTKIIDSFDADTSSSESSEEDKPIASMLKDKSPDDNNNSNNNNNNNQNEELKLNEDVEIEDIQKNPEFVRMKNELAKIRERYKFLQDKENKNENSAALDTHTSENKNENDAPLDTHTLNPIPNKKEENTNNNPAPSKKINTVQTLTEYLNDDNNKIFIDKRKFKDKMVICICDDNIIKKLDIKNEIIMGMNDKKDGLKGKLKSIDNTQDLSLTFGAFTHNGTDCISNNKDVDIVISNKIMEITYQKITDKLNYFSDNKFEVSHHEIRICNEEYNCSKLLDNARLFGNYILGQKYGNESMIAIFKCPINYTLKINNWSKDTMVINDIKAKYCVLIVEGEGIGKITMDADIKDIKKTKEVKTHHRCSLRRIGLLFKSKNKVCWWNDYVDKEKEYNSFSEDD